MATKFYLRQAVSTVAGLLPVARLGGYTITGTLAGAATNRPLSSSTGTTVKATTSMATGSGTIWTSRFISPELDAQTISGTVTYAGALLADQDASGDFMHYWLGVWRPSNGTLVGTLDGTNVGWAGVAAGNVQEAGNSAAITLSSVVAAVGDVLVLELYPGATAASINVQTFYNGTTEGSTSSNAAYINLSQTLAMYPTSLYVALDGGITGRRSF